MEDFLSDIWKGAVEHWLIIASVSSAILMAIFRTAKNHGKVDWLESLMCGVFAMSIWYVLSWFNLPEGAGVLIGGIIGYRGTTATSAWISSKLGFDKEVPKDKADNNE